MSKFKYLLIIIFLFKIFIFNAFGADTKISDLDAITDLDTGDLLVVVDTSASATKKITKDNLSVDLAVPTTDATHDLGSSDFNWRSAYFSTSVIVDSAFWEGISASAARISFVDAAVDEINLIDALVQIGDGTFSWDHSPVANGLGIEGILEVDGAAYFDGSLQAYKMEVSTKTDDYVVTTADLGKSLRLNSAADKNFTLPSMASAEDGARLTFIKQGTGKMTITAVDSDTIDDSSAAGTIYTTTLYATITLEYVDGMTRWVIISANGTFTTT